MEVEFELTPEDVVAFNRHHLKHLPAWQRRIEPAVAWTVWIICILFGAVILTAAAFGLESFAIPILLAVWVGVEMTSLFNGWSAKWTAARTVLRWLENRRDAAKILGLGRLLIDEEGVHIASEFSSCHYRWKGIEKVAATDEYIFIYVMSNHAYIIPLRAFADGRAFNAFADAAKCYHATASDAVREEIGEHPRPTGIQTSEQTSKPGTVEEIIPKERGGPETQAP